MCCPLNVELNFFEEAFNFLFLLIQKLQISTGENATDKKAAVRNLYFLKYMIAADYLTFPKGTSISKQCGANTGNSTVINNCNSSTNQMCWNYSYKTSMMKNLWFTVSLIYKTPDSILEN